MEIKWWNAIKKYSHMKKLEKYEASLLWFFQINVQVELSRDGKTVAVGVKVLEEKMDKIISTQDNGRSVNSNGFSGWCGVPGVPDFVVGLDAQLQELKGMLLKDGVPILVLRLLVAAARLHWRNCSVMMMKLKVISEFNPVCHDLFLILKALPSEP
ncbi:Probable disease resistance protein At5g66900 [Olea europaea subsp. europaea]|uniref:Probable disease resistance protein At5g66900 n=1 Tax=Olea europaea subsp. europaea TaxID=158383 RepID=A0A8S0T892_OLEEU|nr:Probable disease resistance protein At5g66900 [Olea europaea subsp. europaea]